MLLVRISSTFIPLEPTGRVSWDNWVYMDLGDFSEYFQRSLAITYTHSNVVLRTSSSRECEPRTAALRILPV